MVVAQLAERSLPMPDGRGSNPVMRKFFIMNIFTVNCLKEDNKRIREWAIFDKIRRQGSNLFFFCESPKCPVMFGV